MLVFQKMPNRSSVAVGKRAKNQLRLLRMVWIMGLRRDGVCIRLVEIFEIKMEKPHIE